MNQWVNNREVIKDLAINTGTVDTPVYTTLCVTSEVTFTIDNEEKDFYVFCDAIKRSIITGAKVTISATVKIDMNNTAVIANLADIHTLLASGTVSQFNNKMIQFELLEDVASSVLTYQEYTAYASMKLTDLGGASEDEGQYSMELVLNGKATASA